MMASRLQSAISQKNVVFITVKNMDYIRVSQIERLLCQNAASFKVYSSEKGNPITRAIDLNLRMKNIDLSGADVVILGFLPQFIWKRAMKKLGTSKPLLISEFFLSLYDTIVLDRKLISPSSFIAKKLKKLDKRALDEADLCITDTGADADFFAKIYDADRGKFEVLYLEADEGIYKAATSSDGDKEKEEKEAKNIETGYAEEDNAGLTNKAYEVLYFGTGLPLQGTDVVLEAFDKVTKDSVVNWKRHIRCTYIGGTKDVSKALLTKLGNNPQITMISWLSQDELSKKIASSDLCIAGHFNPDIDKADRTIPGKAYIYEAMKKPMILGDTTANHELFTEDDRHFFVPRGDADKLAECIFSRAQAMEHYN